MPPHPDDSTFRTTRRDRLADLLAAASADSPTWTLLEIAAIYRHQMSAPLEFELAAVPTTDRSVLIDFLSCHRSADMRSIFRLSSPPLSVLVLLKDYAKALRHHPDSPLPASVATAIYWLAVAAARVRCGTSITSLSRAETADGLRWTIQQPWIETNEREMLTQALTVLDAPHVE